jgi:glycosyltransferase involved in cell wall biosynthesis
VSERPKMLVFSHISSPVYITGAEKLLLSYIREMNRQFRCVLVAPREGALTARARQSGIEVVVQDIPLSIAMYIAAPHLGSEIEALRQQPAWESVIALLRREKPSYVWVNTCVHPLPAMAAKTLGIPTIWAMMETITDGSHQEEAVRIVNAFSDRIVGISRTVLTPFPPEVASLKATVLPPFLNREELQPDTWSYHRARQRWIHGWEEQHCVAGFIASAIYSKKGFKEFLQALLPLAKADSRIRMLVVGNPLEEEYVNACKALAQRAELFDRIAWVNFADRIEHVYPAMDIVVIPSLAVEGFGMTALEGMTFGKPVVSFASGGLSEVLESTGNSAYLVPPGDITGLMNAVGTLVANEKLRIAVGQRNALAAQDIFNADTFRSRLRSVIASLPPPGEELPELVRSEGPTVYLVKNGRRRPFPSEEAFLGQGFRFEDVTQVPEERLALLPLGEPMPAAPSWRKEAGRRGRSRRGSRRVRGHSRSRSRSRSRSKRVRRASVRRRGRKRAKRNRR